MKTWIINVNGKENEVTFVPNQWSGKHRLSINGENVELKRSLFQAFTGTDQMIHIGGKECRFVLIGNKADIAVDGTYVGSKKTYVPLKSMPIWAWLFIAACMAIPIASLGGALPFLFGVFGSIWCVRVSVSPNMHTAVKLLCCVGISVLAWGLFMALVFIMAGI